MAEDKRYVRITSGGKIKTWVANSLDFLGVRGMSCSLTCTLIFILARRKQDRDSTYSAFRDGASAAAQL